VGEPSDRQVRGFCAAALLRSIVTLRRASAVSNDRLRLLSESAMPFVVESNTSSGCQWQVNSFKSASPTFPGTSSMVSWIIEVMNNNGVTKALNASEVIDASFTMVVNITAKFA
jgi:hypothetical protein